MKNTEIYHELVQKMRTFFLDKGFLEAPTQSHLSILAACEDPFTVSTFKFNGNVWPMIQTGQMTLEQILTLSISLSSFIFSHVFSLPSSEK